jgi:hypothetical protein
MHPLITSIATATALLRNSPPHNRRYPFVARSNTRLNQSKNLFSSPRLSVLGRSSSAASAGLSVSALNAERITEIVMVTANCWQSRPVMPGINAVGTNTADRTKAMAMTGKVPPWLSE